MISREEAKKNNEFDEFTELIDYIYDSVGTCSKCEYYEEYQCTATKDMIYRNPLFFCADFERKQND